jgi:hypothetical protein
VAAADAQILADLVGPPPDTVVLAFGKRFRIVTRDPRPSRYLRNLKSESKACPAAGNCVASTVSTGTTP